MLKLWVLIDKVCFVSCSGLFWFCSSLLKSVLFLLQYLSFSILPPSLLFLLILHLFFFFFFFFYYYYWHLVTLIKSKNVSAAKDRIKESLKSAENLKKKRYQCTKTKLNKTKSGQRFRQHDSITAFNRSGWIQQEFRPSEKQNHAERK